MRGGLGCLLGTQLRNDGSDAKVRQAEGYQLQADGVLCIIWGIGIEVWTYWFGNRSFGHYLGASMEASMLGLELLRIPPWERLLDGDLNSHTLSQSISMICTFDLFGWIGI